MASQPLPFLTVEQYLAIEREAPFRSEYLDGEMFAMAGASPNHLRIVGNAFAYLHQQLRGRSCEPFSNDLRVYSQRRNSILYPDIVVICAPDLFGHGEDTVTDALLVIEVLSNSTKNYDRSEKFLIYRSLPSLAEYIMISQDKVGVEHHTRQPDGSWLLREFNSPADELDLKSIGARLTISSLHERVNFAEDRSGSSPT